MERIEIAHVRFKIVYTGKPTPALAGLDELSKWCGLFHDEGLAPSYGAGSSGNLSFRTNPNKNEFLITASGLALKDRLSRNDFVLVHKFDRASFSAVVSGTKKPSSESPLHHAIYERRPDINAIFHGHCQRVLENAARLKLTQTAKEEESGGLALVDEVTAVLGQSDFIVMKNHGFLSLGKSMEEAGLNAIKMGSSTGSPPSLK